MRIHFADCLRGGHDEAVALRRLMCASGRKEDLVVEDPAQADLILITGIWEGDCFRNLRSQPVWKKYPEKCYGYYEGDNVPSFLHGVYASASRVKGAFNRMQSCGFSYYAQKWPNPYPYSAPLYSAQKQYLLSFSGRRSHTLRKKLFRMKWPDCDFHIVDTTASYDHFRDRTEEDGGMAKMNADYWAVMARSKFALCPRGAGTSSIRLFEAMLAGVAPVIVSDSWIPAAGPDWDEFALFVPERRIAELPAILKAHEGEYVERGRLAAEAYDSWFSEKAAWNQLLAAVEAIRRSQKMPESWFVRGAGIIHLCELGHEWRYRLPILVKQSVRGLGAGIHRFRGPGGLQRGGA